MNELPTKEIFDFLSVWKTRAQLQKKFNLSYAEVYHFIRWASKGKFIQKKIVTELRNDYRDNQKTGVVIIYKKT